MESIRRSLRSLKPKSDQSFDEQFWPVCVALTLLCGFLMGLYVAYLNFDDPRWYANALTWLMLTPLAVSGAMYGLSRLENLKLRRRLELSLVLAVFLHLVLLVVAFETEFADRVKNTFTGGQQVAGRKMPTRKPALVVNLGHRQRSRPDFQEPAETESAQPEPPLQPLVHSAHEPERAGPNTSQTSAPESSLPVASGPLARPQPDGPAPRFSPTPSLLSRHPSLTQPSPPAARATASELQPAPNYGGSLVEAIQPAQTGGVPRTPTSVPSQRRSRGSESVVPEPQASRAPVARQSAVAATDPAIAGTAGVSSMPRRADTRPGPSIEVMPRAALTETAIAGVAASAPQAGSLPLSKQAVPNTVSRRPAGQPQVDSPVIGAGSAKGQVARRGMTAETPPGPLTSAVAASRRQAAPFRTIVGTQAATIEGPAATGDMAAAVPQAGSLAAGKQAVSGTPSGRPSGQPQVDAAVVGAGIAKGQVARRGMTAETPSGHLASTAAASRRQTTPSRTAVGTQATTIEGPAATGNVAATVPQAGSLATGKQAVSGAAAGRPGGQAQVDSPVIGVGSTAGQVARRGMTAETPPGPLASTAAAARRQATPSRTAVGTQATTIEGPAATGDVAATVPQAGSLATGKQAVSGAAAGRPSGQAQVDSPVIGVGSTAGQVARRGMTAETPPGPLASAAIASRRQTTPSKTAVGTQAATIEGPAATGDVAATVPQAGSLATGKQAVSGAAAGRPSGQAQVDSPVIGAGSTAGQVARRGMTAETPPGPLASAAIASRRQTTPSKTAVGTQAATIEGPAATGDVAATVPQAGSLATGKQVVSGAAAGRPSGQAQVDSPVIGAGSTAGQVARRGMTAETPPRTSGVGCHRISPTDDTVQNGRRHPGGHDRRSCSHG